MNWRHEAIVLYERWHWRHADILELDVEDFEFYIEQAKAINEALADAAQGR